MATGNFRTMADFPLIVGADCYIKICPECGCGQDAEGEKCDNCGCDLADADTVFDERYSSYLAKEMQKVADALNDAQPFYEVSIESGHYSGIQFYVEEKYWHIEDMDNEESNEEFGMCRSKMLRKYKAAKNIVRKGLYKAKDDLGLDELICTARFGNGGTWYQKVESNKPLPLKVAVKAAIAAA